MIRRWTRGALERAGLVAWAYDVRSRALYALDRETRASNARFTAAGAPDGLPLPSPELVYRVAGHYNLEWFYGSGVAHSQLIRRVLVSNSVEIGSLGTLLDFGCGCGRVVRHWADLEHTDVHGTDYNVRLVEWCRGALPFAAFSTNELEPPLTYRDATFDFVYAISVFTHLTEDLQHAWMRELERVLAPGGVLLITTKGTSRLEPLDPDERARFDRGELVVQEGRYPGRNLCAAYHPEAYVRDRLAGGLDVVDFVPAEPQSDQSQDIFVLRRPL
jgi:SAM-dependent methyltransferase